MQERRRPRKKAVEIVEEMGVLPETSAELKVVVDLLRAAGVNNATTSRLHGYTASLHQGSDHLGIDHALDKDRTIREEQLLLV